jgi:dUTP pyrophosphatase
MASNGVFTHGGVIDAGYRGEIVVLMSAFAATQFVTAGATYVGDPIKIEAGQKIAQMIPVPVLTGEVVEVDALPPSSRGENGFGSSGCY